MTGPIQPISTGSTAYGLPWKQVTIMSVDGNIAVVRDQLSSTFQMDRTNMRAKGALPQVGEKWIVDRAYGSDWSFAMIVGFAIPDPGPDPLNQMFVVNTAVERDAILDKPVHLTVYQLDTQTIMTWSGSAWVSLGRPSYATIAAIPSALTFAGSLIYHAGLKRLIRYDGTTWDQNYDVDTTYREAVQTSDQVFGGITDLVGASIAFTVANPNTVAQVITTYDIGVSSGFFVGQLVVDSVLQSREAHAGGSRQTCTQTYRVPLGAGLHTMKMRGAFTATTGTCYGTHTLLTVTITDR